MNGPAVPFDLCLILDAASPPLKPLLECLLSQENISLADSVLALHVMGGDEKLKAMVRKIQNDYATCFLGVAVTFTPEKMSRSRILNQQMLNCSQPYMLVLSPSATLDSLCLDELARATRKNPETTAVWQPRNSLRPYSHYYDPRDAHLPHAEPGCLLINRAAFEEAFGMDPKLGAYGSLVDLSWRLSSMGYHIQYVPRARFQEEGDPSRTAQALEDNLKLRIRYGTSLDILKGVWFWATLFRRRNKKRLFPRLTLLALMARVLWRFRYFRKFPRDLVSPKQFHGLAFGQPLPHGAGDRDLDYASLSSSPIGIIPPEPLDEEHLTRIRAMIANQTHRTCQLCTREQARARPDAFDYYIFLEPGDQLYPTHCETLVSLAHKRNARLTHSHAMEKTGFHILSGRTRLPLACYLIRRDTVGKFLALESADSIRTKLAYIPAAELAEVSVVRT